MTRTSTCMSRTPPTRRMTWSSSTRSSLACSSGESSPISSRKSVPPSAASNRPFFICLASVKAPFSWPKSSASIRVSGMAEQLMATKAPFWRELS